MARSSTLEADNLTTCPSPNVHALRETDLGDEAVHVGGRVLLGIPRHVSSSQVLNRDVLDVEAHVLPGQRGLKALVVHLDGLHLRRELSGREQQGHPGLQDPRLHLAHRNGADSWEGGGNGARVTKETATLFLAVDRVPASFETSHPKTLLEFSFSSKKILNIVDGHGINSDLRFCRRPAGGAEAAC